MPKSKILLKILIYAAFIMLAPFAIELVIMAEIVGVEAAMAFLVLYGRSVLEMLSAKLTTCYRVVRSFVALVPDEALFTHEIVVAKLVYGVIGFGLVGSLVVCSYNLFILFA